MPNNDAKDVVYFARTDYRGDNRLFGLKRIDRRQHTYVVGKTGTGKSTLLENLIIQDVANGEGLCVVDPHGELVETILKKIPEHRIDDVVYFNPADSDYSVGFNILELPDPKYKHLVASGLMGIFTKIWAGTWSARMEYILNNAVLALLETPGSTLLGITRILVDKEYRQKVIENVTDPVVRAFWVNEYESWRDQFRNEAIAPIQNKVGQFLSTALVRNIVGQQKSTIDVFDIMNSGKIFLVNVSKGRIGEDNSALLGAMLITKIQLAAMERVRLPDDERVDFYLYVDEFQNFATDSFAGILSEARKYRLNLTVAHQYIGQLVSDTSTKVRDAIFGNVGTMIVFRVGAADAEFLENEFEPEFTIQDIVNLPNRHIYLKLMVNGITTRPFSAATLAPFQVKNAGVEVGQIIERSRKLYGRSRTQIESDINRWSTTLSADEPAGGRAPAGSPFANQGGEAGEGGDGQGGPMTPRSKKQAEGMAALADLGIEFDEAPKVNTGSNTAAQKAAGGYAPRPQVPQRQPETVGAGVGATAGAAKPLQQEPREVQPEADAKSQEKVKEVSLSSLKPTEDRLPKTRQREKVDINSLKNAISQALGTLDSDKKEK